MEGNVNGSFLQENTWKNLADESGRSTGSLFAEKTTTHGNGIGPRF